MQRIAERYHDFSYGHRVFGHENKCAHLHGHNGRVTFTVTADDLDDVGRILDFGEIGRLLCNWIEENWDHRFLVWEEDPLSIKLAEIDSTVVWVPFNPTAENLAEYLVNIIGPKQLARTGAVLLAVKFDETRKCSATYNISAEPFHINRSEKVQESLFKHND